MANHHSKNGVIIIDNSDTVSLNADKKNKKTKKKPQKYTEHSKLFHQFIKEDQNLSKKNIHSKNNSGKPHPNNTIYSRQPSHDTNYRRRSSYQRVSQNVSQNFYGRSHSRNSQYQNNYS